MPTETGTIRRMPADIILVGQRRGEEIYYSASLDTSYIVRLASSGGLSIRPVQGKIKGCCG